MPTKHPHRIRVCFGRTCGPKCAGRIEDALKQYRDEHPEKNLTQEKQFCFGYCKDANNVSIDDKLYSFQTPEKIIQTLRKIDDGESPPHRALEDLTDESLDKLMEI